MIVGILVDMKYKATHQGHCQVCNRIQKLPNDLMAKHGYAVLGGYFEGTCYGSDHLPLEVSKDMVVKSIAITRDRIKEFEHAIRLWSEPATEPEAWFHEYVSFKNGLIKPHYMWRRVQLEREIITRNDFTYNEDTFIGHDGKKNSLRTYSIHGDTLLAIANQLNQQYIDQFLRKGIKDMTEYIHNQHHRIAVWHQQPLLAITPEVTS